MKLKQILQITLFISLLLVTAQAVLAQYGIPIKPELAPFTETLPNSDFRTDARINTVLNVLAGGLVYLATPIAIIMIVFYGWKLVTSMGEQEGYDGAKKGLTWAIIGLIVILLSVSIVRNIIEILISTDDDGAIIEIIEEEIIEEEDPFKEPGGTDAVTPLPSDPLNPANPSAAA